MIRVNGYRKFIGIDPGANGFVSVLIYDEYDDLVGSDYLPMPMVYGRVGGLELYDFLLKHKDCEVCVVEDVHAIYGSSAKSNFSFGRNVGGLHAILDAVPIKFELIQPKTWQSGVILGGINSKDTKVRSIHSAGVHFPLEDLRKSSRATKPHDGKTDSMLMALYGKKFLAKS